jgi:hypothetical protein
MSTGVDRRHRGPKGRREIELASSGREHGRIWASSKANYGQLRAIVKLEFTADKMYALQFDDLLGCDPADWHDSFWFDGSLAVSFPHDVYVEAFVHGVRSFWEEIIQAGRGSEPTVHVFDGN